MSAPVPWRPSVQVIKDLHQQQTAVLHISTSLLPNAGVERYCSAWPAEAMPRLQGRESGGCRSRRARTPPQDLNINGKPLSMKMNSEKCRHLYSSRIFIKISSGSPGSRFSTTPLDWYPSCESNSRMGVLDMLVEVKIFLAEEQCSK